MARQRARTEEARRLKILQLHNTYRSGLGGEDTVLGLEQGLLAAHGHEVRQFGGSNAGIGTRKSRLVSDALNAVWSARSYADVLRAIRETRPDIVHVHNTFAALSASALWAVRRAGVPCVATLHNYRLTCAGAMLYRNGCVCEECVGRVPWAAIVRRCRYSGSLGAGLTIACAQLCHRVLGTYRRKVDAFIVLSEFQKGVMIRAGLPPDRLFVKPNFVPDPPLPARPVTDRRKRIVFAGLLAEHKGPDLLLSAWRKLGASGWRLMMIGDGPDAPQLMSEFGANGNVEWAGRMDRDGVLRSISESKFLVLPSRCIETMGMTVLEALALSTPVIVPNHGPFPEMLSNGAQGLLFDANDVDSLANVLRKAVGLSDDRWSESSCLARRTYLDTYTPEANYEKLMGIYAQAARARGVLIGSNP